MKREKHKKPKFRNSVLLFCYLTGVFDRWFHRNKGEVEDAAFLAKRIAAFTDYVAVTMTRLEEVTAPVRNEAQVIMSTLDGTDQIVGKSMGQKRARKLMESKKAELIKLDGVIRAESVKATELLLPYVDKLKAQTIAYAHGYKRPIADAKVSVFFNVEQNSAYLGYQQMNAITDTAVHKKAMAYTGVKEEV